MNENDAIRALKTENLSINSTQNITWLSLVWGHLAAAFLTKKANVVNLTHVAKLHVSALAYKECRITQRIGP